MHDSWSRNVSKRVSRKASGLRSGFLHSSKTRISTGFFAEFSSYWNWIWISCSAGSQEITLCSTMMERLMWNSRIIVSEVEGYNKLSTIIHIPLASSIIWCAKHRFLGLFDKNSKKNLNECPVSKWPLREKLSILKLENVCDTFLSGHWYVWATTSKYRKKLSSKACASHLRFRLHSILYGYIFQIWTKNIAFFSYS